MAGKTESDNGGPASRVIAKVKTVPAFLHTGKGIALFLLLVAIVFNAVLLWPEAGVPAFSMNSDVLHLTATQQAASVLRQHLDPTDFWLPPVGLGFALFHQYEHLPLLVLAGIGQVTSFILPLPRLFDISRYLLLVFFPASVFRAMRRFGFDYSASGFSALIASLVSANGLLGIEYGSYIWRGYGLYTQLWAMFFLPLALAEIYRTIRKEGSWFWPVFLSAVVILSNPMYGLILVLSAALMIFLTLDMGEIVSRFIRSAGIFILTGLVTSYFFIPLLLDSASISHSILLSPLQYNSLGAAGALLELFSGNLLDYGRLPVLTILFFLAAIFVIRQVKKEHYRFALVFTVFWLLLFFGRPFWGVLDILPFGRHIEYLRCIAGFQLGAIMVTGAGLPLLWQWMKKYSFRGPSFHLPEMNPERLNILVLSPVITTLAIGIVCILVYGFPNSTGDLLVYYRGVQNILIRQWPWDQGVEFYYPPLAFLPVMIAYAVSCIGGGFLTFMVAMWALMLLCAIVTTVCVYYIGLKLYPEKVAFTAALLNATAVSVAYYVLCRFDPFPACLAMAAVLATLYGDSFRGYLASVLGLFAKIWPIVLFPFFWIYNARHSSLAEEGKKQAFAFVLAGGLIFGLMLWWGYDRVFGYADMFGFTSHVYCNTIPFTVSHYLRIVNIDVPFASVALVFRILTVIVVLGALYLMYRQPENIARMLKLILVVIVVAIMFSQYRSPQYIVWFTPFAALLVADDLFGIAAFTAVQVLGFIEYPLSYDVLWENARYLSDLAPLFFAVFFIVLGLLLWRALNMKGPDMQQGDDAGWKDQ